MSNRTGTPILHVRNVSKSFGGGVVQALEDVSLTVYPNEIVGVVGENGAGKTTLMKILVGVHTPDAGEWEYNGVNVPFPKNPKEAARKGISIVYQEKGVIPSLKVYQFMFLGNEERYKGRLGLQINKMKSHAREILKEFHVVCDIEDFMRDLPLSTQKMVEITKAVLSIRLEQDSDTTVSVIILDEPTAPLTIEERRDLLEEISRMKKNTSFVFVTHIMQEVMEYMDKVVVLRDGKCVDHYDMSVDKVTENDLAKAIVGKELLGVKKEENRRDLCGEEIVLSAQGLSIKGVYYDISFDLHHSECIGIFGPAGSGKSEIIKTIAGIKDFDSGTLAIKSRKSKPKDPPHKRLKNGVGYFSGDMANELLYEWPITKNISILNMDKIARKGLKTIRFSAEKKMALAIKEMLRIRTPDVSTAISTLSGGNKQKVTVGKWFEKNPDILLLEDPTIGIDVGSRQDIYETILSMKRKGTSMLLVSDDIKEYSILCDRIILLKQGRIKGIIQAEQLNEVMKT